VRAIVPDVAIVHALRADAEGNCQYDGPEAIDADAARAARRVVVTCEEIVDREVIEANPAATKIPGFLVDAVIEAPFGAHPTTHVPRYGFDAWQVGEYAAAARREETWAPYLAQIAAETEQEYRERVLPPQRRRVMEALALGRTRERAAA
jgi:acyl CoA:acetate/3-ketoacid CoA transferase